MDYQDGIDTESVSYKFYNSLSAFRVGNQKEIQIHDVITKRAEPSNDAQFITLLKSHGLDFSKYEKKPMFEKGFDENSLYGNQAQSANLLEL